MKRNTHETIKETVQTWVVRIGVEKPSVQFRSMRKKWASISTNGRLTLNKELLNLPYSLVEYVIVHELVHLLVPNHGKLYKAYMSSYIPDWQDRKKQLDALTKIG
ncbi:M48 family metallopeptidase [Candidatus Poribacteria bacterium]|nr:M48 family metallopeptidase [Candidatus Poribacteria bacterium]